MTKTIQQIHKIGGEAGQAQHTSGIWERSHDAEGVFTIHAIGNNKAGACIATVTSFKDDFAEVSEAEAEANARRICAAVNACRGTGAKRCT